jgi:2-amino-4-hydroxy-6-hydroxymethyldihydropteridine diphosphokinase
MRRDYISFLIKGVDRSLIPDVLDQGELWKETFYAKIRDSLGFSEKADRESRDLLLSLLSDDSLEARLQKVEASIKGKSVVVFGAGPSLVSDLHGLKGCISEKDSALIAADGAADALKDFQLQPDLVVSDLDSCSLETLQSSARTAFLFVHAHGNNMNLVRTIIPQIKATNIFGTTQVESAGSVHNYGGFTDGDRACYIAASFSPASVTLAGMDFGKKEGNYSISKYHSEINPKRPLKLEWGKKSLEFLIGNRKEIRFRNVTKFGEEIQRAQKIMYDEL